MSSRSSADSQSQDRGVYSVPVERSALQMQFFLLMLVVCIWLTFGRGVLGSLGWAFLIHLFTLVPLLLIYGAVIQAILTVRHKKSGYTLGGLTKGVIYSMLGLAVVYGLTLVDGGDTPESVNSVVTGLFGISQDSAIATGIGIVSSLSFYLFLASLLAILILTLLEKRLPKRHLHTTTDLIH